MTNATRTAHLLGVAVFFVALSLVAAQTTCTGDFMSIRTFDGTCNNLANPDLASSGSFLFRTQEGFAYTETSPPFQTGVEANRPNLRDMSNRILASGANPKTRKTCNRLALLHSSFGQFLTHDMTLTPQVELGLSPDPEVDQFSVDILDPNDPFLFLPFPPFSPKPIPDEFKEIRGGNSITAIINGVKEVKNIQTHFLDMSTLYWRNETNMNQFRTFVDGKLKLQDYAHTNTYNPFFLRDTFSNPEIRTIKNTLPNFNATGTPIDFVIHITDPLSEVLVSGDERTSENMALATVHLLFYLEHNNCADEVKAAHPSWTDEQIFQKARHINTAQYQHVIYNEWLPLLVGDYQVERYLGPYGGYDSTVNPTTSTLFAHAAGRYGHSTIIDRYPLYDQCAAPDITGGWGGSIIQATQNGGPTSPLRIVAGAGGHDEIMRSMMYTPMEDIDHLIMADMRNIVIGTPFLTGIDIPVLNMARSRVNGIPDFSTVYKAWNGLFPDQNDLYDTCGSTATSPGPDQLACFTSWMQSLEDVPDFAPEVQDVYGKLIYLDTWFAFLAEKKEIGSNLGRTLSRVMLDEFRRKRAGDRFWYENLPNLPNLPGTSEPPLTAAELAAVKTKTMASIIQRSFPEILTQEEAFVAPVDPQAAFAGCSTVARLRVVNDTETLKAALYSGNTVALGATPIIEADTTGTVLSVKFDISGPGYSKSITVNTPASIQVSDLEPDTNCQSFTVPADVTITATPFPLINGGGTAGTPLERTVTVTGTPVC